MSSRRCVRRALLALGVLAFASCTRLPAEAAAQQLTRAAARADLDSLAAIVRHNSAYRLVNGFPFDAHLDSVARGLPDSIPIRAYWRMVQTAVGALQDAHSNVRLPQGVAPPATTGVLPFALTTAGDTAVALAPCRCRLFVAEFPRAVAINDVTIDSLMRLAGIRFAGHSPQRLRFRALGALTQIDDVLRLAGADRAGRLAVRLRGQRGDTVVHVTTAPRPDPGPLPPAAELEMAESIAVLTIRRMTESADTIVRNAIESAPFRASRAVLIDVRGNDGGTRDVLETLVPLLIRRPLVYNVAVVRVDTNGVGDRALVVPDDRSLPQAARTALRSALAAFRPSWRYPVNDFLPVRFGAVLMPADSSRSISDRPVAILTDEGCFSSCDIFLGAARLAPRVTLIGTPSAGGSGRSRDFVLPHSRLTVVLSTMASFQPGGELYDGIGIRPTIVVERTIADLAVGRDTQKEAAIAFLRRHLASSPFVAPGGLQDARRRSVPDL